MSWNEQEFFHIYLMDFFSPFESIKCKKFLQHKGACSNSLKGWSQCINVG